MTKRVRTDDLWRPLAAPAGVVDPPISATTSMPARSRRKKGLGHRRPPKKRPPGLRDGALRGPAPCINPKFKF